MKIHFRSIETSEEPMKYTSLLFMILTAFSASTGRADLQFVQKSETTLPGQAPRTAVYKVHIHSQRFRLDIETTRNRKKVSQTYLVSDKGNWFIDHSEKAYDFRAGLTPQNPASPKSTLRYEKLTGANPFSTALPCDPWAVYLNAEKVYEVCIADTDSLGISKGFGPLVASLWSGPVPSTLQAAYPGKELVELQRITYMKGTKIGSLTLSDIKRGPIAPEMFLAPKDYSARSLRR